VSNQKRVSYAAFEQWEIKMVEKKVGGLMGKFGFTRSDAGDLRQELFLQIHLYRSGKGAAPKEKEKSWVSKILDNRLRNIIDAVKSEKRKVHLHSDSLQKEVEIGEGNQVVTYEDILREDQAHPRWGRKPIADEEEMRQAVSFGARHLTGFQKKVSRLLQKGHSVTEVSDILRIKRTTLNDEIKRIRKTFFREGLDEYL
jgi:DNA-directed RNA polymerase specialized sigma24 family protein